MIVRKLADVVGTKGESHRDKWHSLRLLDQEDGMSITLTDSVLEVGFQLDFWQKNHLEICYCIEGEGTVEELDTGVLHEINAGTLYATDDHDRHRIQARTCMRIIRICAQPLVSQADQNSDRS